MSLKVSNVSKRFQQVTAVKDISFELETGKMLGFLGRNGAGKTTTFRMILGLTEPSEGEIHFNGHKINTSNYNEIGYLPEERGLHAKLKVVDELTYLATLKGMNKKDIKKAIDYWLDRFHITEHRDKKIESLSKGNQQKVQLLASMIHEPQLLILDEPFSGLDPVNVELLKKAVIDLNQQGTTIIFSSHRMEHIEELCDDVCILNRGQMVVQGPLQQVKRESGYQRVIVDADYDLQDLATLPGVLEMKITPKGTLFMIENEQVAHHIYQELQTRGFVRHFEILDPTIQEIFIEKVGDIHE
ncbi:ABC transporter ATP-binding protein [Staphylococcus chromogenes]|uniref:ABC transporter ATP-binding protein n=1 Tax=Staphylococcus chromogenes TaxID=46126 RepID=UPI000D1AC3EC|nr:ABC transporter ATP-binding protein [Staphylococcus chromogenes]MDT0655483.1 ABC transporter ATP-binding protein [Staphylococcus chromogenes]MDT0693727.1 ABC transporter ATP-binding protein [Staphylococcus chromogenes]MDT0698247.1 ABC transporter ATP-binding protein [Staphylococcus chromogenes]PTG03430.1 sodium ABC transporter ATP-binding protein [Staphylococcus chromogenes]PTG53630.1 sodium ABC transporter ATP-binding protein [Staphylococcus chromogenes]